MGLPYPDLKGERRRSKSHPTFFLLKTEEGLSCFPFHSFTLILHFFSLFFHILHYISAIRGLRRLRLFLARFARIFWFKSYFSPCRIRFVLDFLSRTPIFWSLSRIRLFCDFISQISHFLEPISQIAECKFSIVFF